MRKIRALPLAREKTCPSIAAMSTRSAATQLETLLNLQRDLALETDIDKVLGRIVETATRMLDAERATLYVVDAAKNELWSRVLTEGTEPGVTDVREIRVSLDGRSEEHTSELQSPYDLVCRLLLE